MLLAACGAEPTRLRLVETSEPAGYDGLQFEVLGTGAPGRILLWPQEGISIAGRFEPVRRSQIADLVTKPDGAISYAVRGLASDSLALDVRIRAAGERIELDYRVSNAGPSALFVTLEPCLQLPVELFDGLPGWARSKRVFVVTAQGPRWIADAQQTRGVGRRGEPDPGRTSPWAQHFRASGSARGGVPPVGLARFGIADELALFDWIGAAQPRSDLVILALADSHIGVGYGLLNCLHAGLGGRVPARESVTFRSRILVSRRALDELLREEAPAAGETLVADAAFVPARARMKVLESFERGVPAGWSAPGGSLSPARPRLGARAPTDRDAQLEAVLPPSVALESPELVISAFPAQPSWLSVDVSAPGLGPHPELVFTLVGPDAERSASGPLARGKPRRFVVAVPDAWLGAPLTLRIGLRDASAPTRLLVDALVLHSLTASELPQAGRGGAGSSAAAGASTP